MSAWNSGLYLLKEILRILPKDRQQILILVQSLRFGPVGVRNEPLKAESHIACRAHNSPMPFPRYAVPLRV
jgi:hypothetical protein